MIVTSVHIRVLPAHREAFIAATRANVAGSLGEPGCLRFDFLAESADPERFLLVEAYRSPADVEAHRKTAHYLRWRETVEPMMAEPRRGVKHDPILPADEAGWRSARA